MPALNPGLNGPFAAPLARAFAPGARSFISRAIAVLRKFGSDAHVYLPGIRMLNGLQASNYLDSAGTTLAAVDGPVGRVNDAAGSLGVELIPPITSAAVGWSNSATGSTSITFGEGIITFVTDGLSIGAASYSGIGVAGKTYEVIVTSTGTGQIKVVYGGSEAVISVDNFKSTLVYGVTGTAFSFSRVVSQSANRVITNISVREVTGIHATQTLTGSKPILRKDANGKYYWQFDGSNDSLQLGGPLFQMADDHCVLAGARCDSASGDRTVFSARSTASDTPILGALDFTAGVPRAYWRDDAGVGVGITGVATPTECVLALRKVGNTKELFVNADSMGVNTTALGATTITSAAIGVRPIGAPNSYMQGAIYPVIAIKGTVTDPDLLLLEKLVGQMSGVVIP